MAAELQAGEVGSLIDLILVGEKSVHGGGTHPAEGEGGLKTRAEICKAPSRDPRGFLSTGAGQRDGGERQSGSGRQDSRRICLRAYVGLRAAAPPVNIQTKHRVTHPQGRLKTELPVCLHRAKKKKKNPWPPW